METKDEINMRRFPRSFVPAAVAFAIALTVPGEADAQRPNRAAKTTAPPASSKATGVTKPDSATASKVAGSAKTTAGPKRLPDDVIDTERTAVLDTTGDKTAKPDSAKGLSPIGPSVPPPVGPRVRK